MVIWLPSFLLRFQVGLVVERGTPPPTRAFVRLRLRICVNPWILTLLDGL